MNVRILAVIVSYNPDLAALEQTLTTLQSQSVECVIVDNASENIDEVQDSLTKYSNAQIESLTQNFGLAYAHNQGIEIAKKGGFNHVLLLDQDSVPLPDMVKRLLDVSLEKSKTSKVSAVGARYFNPISKSESFFVRFGTLKFQRHYCPRDDSINEKDPQERENYIEADFLISSGSLIALEALAEIGNMDQDLFIDHVDTEWFLRAHNMGYKAYGVCDALMQHSLGEKTHQINYGGRQRNVPQHKPFRYYYIFRNSIALYKRGYASALWKWNDLQRLSFIFIMYGCIKSPRRANLSMMAKGIWHGLTGKLGKFDG